MWNYPVVEQYTIGQYLFGWGVVLPVYFVTLLFVAMTAEPVAAFVVTVSTGGGYDPRRAGAPQRILVEGVVMPLSAIILTGAAVALLWWGFAALLGEMLKDFFFDYLLGK